MTRVLTFTFPLEGGLHARPAAALRERALAHDAQCEWVNTRSGRQASLGNLLSLLATETRQGDPCRLEATGPGAARALADLEGFLNGAFLACDAQEPASADATQGLGSVVPGLLARSRGPWWPGSAVAPGVGMGAVRFAEANRQGPLPVPAGDSAAEILALRQALARLGTTLRAEAARGGNATQRAVLEAHQAMLEDQTWIAAMEHAILHKGCSAATAAQDASQAAADALRQSQVLKLQERALDVEDLGDRLVVELTGQDPAGSALVLTAPAILVARDLTPSRFLALDRTQLRGLVLTHGGGTSHTAILARSFGIPCVAGLAGLPGDLRGLLQAGQALLVDGDRGLVVPDPDEDLLAYYQVVTKAREQRALAAAGAALRPALTADGLPFRLRANILTAGEALPCIRAGANGIGLFRTEMLFLDQPAPPTEAVQMEAYREALQAAAGQPVVVRLLDVGGDKPLPYLPLPAEANPFLGCRGVRWYAGHADLILTQLRAALRATLAGELRLMVPMVAEVEELRAVRALVAQAEASLTVEGLPFKAKVPLGIMVEVPAAAFNLEALAREADFLCVGTNDLVQYLFAADRGEPAVAKPSHSWHPATLRTLAGIVRSAGRAGRPLSLCGEMAGDPRLLPLLVGLGFQDLSVAPPLLGELKATLATLSVPACRALVERALQAGTSSEVEALLQEAMAPGHHPLVEPALVVLDASCRTKEEAIKLLVERLGLLGRTRQPGILEEAVWAREQTYATGVGHGFAVPHCKSPAATASSMAVLRLKTPLDWGALDGQPVDLVVLLAMGGQDADHEHLRVFARLARKLVDGGFRDALRAAPSPEALVAILQANVLLAP